MVLKELNVPYEADFLDLQKVKQEPFISTNPNGRVPAIDDPNTGLTLWESGAILQYLVAKYDSNHTISFPAGSDAQFKADQWLFFQCSGQGPYYGQAAWFGNFHHEKLPSAIERYQKEAIRIVEVIDGFLGKTGQEWLVADGGDKKGKCTYADISFIPWGNNLGWLLGRDLFEGGSKYPHYHAWMERLKARPAVAASLKEQADVKAKSAH